MNPAALAQWLVAAPPAPAGTEPVLPLAPSLGRPFSNVFESWAPRKKVPVAHLGPGASPVPAPVVSPELRRLVAAPEPSPEQDHPRRTPRPGRSAADEAVLAAWVSTLVPPPARPLAQPLPAPPQLRVAQPLPGAQPLPVAEPLPAPPQLRVAQPLPGAQPVPAPPSDAPAAERAVADRSVAAPPPVVPAALPVRLETPAPTLSEPAPAPAPSRVDTVPSELSGLAGATFTRPASPAAAEPVSAPTLVALEEVASFVVAGPPPVERPTTDAPGSDPGQPPPERQSSPDEPGFDEVSFGERSAGEAPTEARPLPTRVEPLPSRTSEQAAAVPPSVSTEVEVVEARTELAPDLHVEVRAEGHRLEVVVHTTPSQVSQYHDLGAELQASLQHGGFDLGGFSARGDRREPSTGPAAHGPAVARPNRPRAARRGGRYA